jgi:hypothetical protein
MSLSRRILPVLAGGLAASSAQGAEITLDLTLPEMTAPAYYRPYLAAWVESAEGAPQATLAVWYDTRLRDNLGTGFLKNLRSWWRASGEAMTLPADGISGPTRGPGSYQIRLSGDTAPLADLAPGAYTLAVEVAREDGGRDLVRLPFAWTGTAARETTRGAEELGAVTLTVEP